MTGPVTDLLANLWSFFPSLCLQSSPCSILPKQKEKREREKDSSADLELLELLFGAGVEDVGRVWVRCSELSGLQPVFKAREVVHELTPQTPGLLNPEHNRGDNFKVFV